MSAREVDLVVDRLSAALPRTALLIDFDGTLAPIVADPGDSALPAGTFAALERLASTMAAVAVVSGRPAAFLVDRVPVAGVRRLGLYGLEEADRHGTVCARPEVAPWQPAVTRARAELERIATEVPGAWVEDKGLSVAVHWRGAADHEAAQAALAGPVAALARELGLAREPGKLVEELRPPVAWDKGTVVEAIVDEVAPSELAYAGDDRGDLPALRAVTARGGLAIVVDHGDETPPEVRAAADVVLDGVDELARVLAILAEPRRGVGA